MSAIGSKSKSKATTFSPVTQVLNANLANSTFGFLPAVGWKGKSPASSSRSVNLQPDLDLLSGFAFLSFASLDELETHVERNEATSATLSVNVGQKRKAESSDKPQGDNLGLYVPQGKRKAVSAKKKPVKKIATSVSDAAAKPKQSLPKAKTDKVSLVGTILDEPELSRFTPIDVSARRSEINEQSSNVFSEISLLCSEIVDLGDDEDCNEEIFKSPSPNAVADSTNSDVRDGWVGASTATNAAAAAAACESAVVAEGIATASEPAIPKKKKKKKRKNEHCDQTSQTKFRIKKKKKSESKRQDLEESPNATLNELKTDECLDLTLQDVENSQCEGGNGENVSTHEKFSLSRPMIEKVSCARTAAYQGCAKGSSLKSKPYASESSSGGRVIDLTDNTSSSKLGQAKMVEKLSLDGCTPNSSDREIDVGDESALSDLSDHSSDIETDPGGCFLLNNKIDKVEKEKVMEEGDEIVDVDVETVGKETRKNFLVVSGVEAGHFSYHPGMTKDGTIDTSIQALPNEIDIFLQCAKMQEGEMIKIINPDDSDELHSHFMQKNGRNPETVKATRSATERKRRHHLGDLFSDMKLAVFTDLVDADLYLSKQAILSKGIGTIEDLEKEARDIDNAKKQLTKTNKKLKEKRNMLMFGKASVDVDSAKVEAIFNHLNIVVDDEETVKTEENSNSNEDVAVDAADKSKVAVEPSVKGRPRAKKTLLAPWVANNTPLSKNKDDLSSTAADLYQKTSTKGTLETSKEILGTTASSSQTLPDVNISNVSCGVQTLEVEKDSSKSFTLGNPTISLSSVEKDSSKSFTLGNPPFSLLSDSHAVKGTPLSESTNQDSLKSFALGNPPVSSSSDSHASKGTSLSELKSQESSKASLPVKILPKPTILQLNPTQQKAFMDTLGQVKQPSSDKIICNLSRLSTQQNPSKPSSICIIRSGQLVKSLDSKNVMHIKITNDALKSVDGGSSSPTAASTSQSSQQVSDTTTATRVPGFLTLGVAKVPEAPGTSRPQTSQKRPENTVLVSHIPLKSTTTPSPKVIFGGKPLGMLTSTSNTGKSQNTSQASSEMTLRALASLSQLQANKPPVMGTAVATKPVGFNENPVTGILTGKNVVMKVVPARPEARSTTFVLPTLPTATMTTAFKGATSSQVTVTTSQGKCPTSTKGPTFSVIPVISVPSSSSLNRSFTVSALNSPILSSGVGTLPTATVTTAAFKGAASSQVLVTSSQGKCPTTTRGQTFSVIPVVSVPSSSSVNRSFTVSALNSPLLSSGISTKVDASTQLIKACVDPFNLVPKQPTVSNPSVTIKPNLPSTSIDLGTELNNLLRSESTSPTSEDIFEEPSKTDDISEEEPEPSETYDIFEVPSSSSTVLTQEMLKIPGIEQSPDVPLASLPEVFENLTELDKTTDAVKSQETSCDIEEKKPEGSDICGVSSSSHSSRIQADVPSLPVRSPIVGAKTPINPLKVEIKDFRKGTGLVKKDNTLTEQE